MESTPLRSEDVREKNEKLVLRYIQHSQGISQSEIVQKTGLKAPTVLRIFSILEADGLIMVQKNPPERDFGDKKGRRPVYYTVNPRARYVIGLEFWSLTAFILVVDFARNPVYSLEICLREDVDALTIYSQLEKLIAQAITESGIDPARILGLGVGAPGQVDVKTGEIISYRKTKGFTNFNLGQRLHERFGCRVKVANNAGVIALHAYRQGVAKESHALFTFFIRRGVGGAFIHEGNLFSVLGKTAFEVGHTIVNMDGKSCYCGSRGCLEAYISEAAILESLEENDLHFDTIEEVEQRLAVEDRAVTDIVRQCARYLSVSGQSVLRLLSPDGFLIITRFRTLSRIFADELEQMIRCDACEDCVQVYHNAYAPLEAGLGACDLIFDEYLH